MFSPNGKLIASGSGDKTIKIWDVTNGQLLHTLDGHTYSVRSVCYSPNGNQIASGSEDLTIKIWNVTNGQLLHTLNGHTGSVNSVSYSPNGNQIASGSGDNTIKIWDVTNGNLISHFGSKSEALESGYDFVKNLDEERKVMKSNISVFTIWYGTSSAKLELEGANISECINLDRRNFELMKELGCKGEPQIQTQQSEEKKEN